MNRTRRIGPETFVPFREIDTDSGGSASFDTQPNCRKVFAKLLHFCHHTSSAFCWVVPQPSSAEMSTVRRIYIPFRTLQTDIREDANSHKVIQCKHLPSSLCTAVERASQTGLRPLTLTSSSTRLYLLVLVARRVERLSVSVFHDHDSRVGNCIWSPLEHCLFAFH